MMGSGVILSCCSRWIVFLVYIDEEIVSAPTIIMNCDVSTSLDLFWALRAAGAQAGYLWAKAGQTLDGTPDDTTIK